jgi:hypothetical protein
MPVRSFVLFSCGFTVPFIEAIHQVDIDENQRDKNINRSLLCEPEAETKTANLNFVEIVHKQDATTVRDDEPYNQQGTKGIAGSSSNRHDFYRFLSYCSSHFGFSR